MNGENKVLVDWGKKLFSHKKFKLQYRHWGGGEMVWLTFHGFGQTHASFEKFAEALSAKSTLYNFDIPFHGNSHFNSPQPMKKEEWAEVIKAFLDSHFIFKFSVVGFSIGCRLIPPIIEAFPGQVEKVVLIAPDGIKNNFWYFLAMLPLFRGLLKYLVFKPRLFMKFTDFLLKYAIGEKTLILFARSMMTDRKSRWRVYKTWINYRKLEMNRDSLAHMLNKNMGHVIIILSNQDKVISRSSLKPFINQLNSCSLINIDSSHHKLIEKSADLIVPYIAPLPGTV